MLREIIGVLQKYNPRIAIIDNEHLVVIARFQQAWSDFPFCGDCIPEPFESVLRFSERNRTIQREAGWSEADEGAQRALLDQLNDMQNVNNPLGNFKPADAAHSIDLLGWYDWRTPFFHLPE